MFCFFYVLVFLCFTVATRSVLLMLCPRPEASADKSLRTFSYTKTTVSVFCSGLIDTSPVSSRCKATTSRGIVLHYVASPQPEQACAVALFHISPWLCNTDFCAARVGVSTGIWPVRSCCDGSVSCPRAGGTTSCTTTSLHFNF